MDIEEQAHSAEIDPLAEYEELKRRFEGSENERQRLQEELQRTRAEANQLIQLAPTGIYEIDFQGPRFSKVNDAMCQMLGYSREELLAINPFDLLQEDSKKIFQERVQRTLSGEAIESNVEYRVITKEGKEIYVILNTSFTYREGKPYSALVIAHDVTERRQAEARLKESEERYRTLIETSPNAIFVHADNHFLFANQAVLELFGAETFEQLSNYTILELLTPDERPAIQTRIQETLRGVRTPRRETRITRLDGREVPIEAVTGLIEYQGRPAIQVIVHDISDRKQAEKALRLSEEKFAKVFRSSPTGLTITRFSDGCFLDANESYLQMIGYGRDEVIGHTSVELHLHPSVEARWKNLSQLSDPGGVHNREMTIPTKSGELRQILFSKEPLEVNGEACILATTMDITERKKMEAALRESEEKFRILADSSPLIIWMSDAQGGNRFVNRTYREYFQVTLEQVEGDQWQPLFHPEDATAYIENFMRAVQSHTSFAGEARIRRPNGEWRWLSTYAEPRFSSKGEFLGHAGNSQDVTERKQAEALQLEYIKSLRQHSEELEMARSEAVTEKHRLEAVLEALPVGVLITDERGGIAQMNAAFEQVWGGKPPETHSVNDYKAYQGRWVESGKEVEPEEWASAHAVQKGETVIGQMIEIQRFNGSIGYVLNSAAPVWDAKGKTIGSAVAIQDITRLQEAEQALKEANQFLEHRVKERTAQLEQTAQELEKALQNEKLIRQQLIQAEKYAALARLIASVAHEINNPLQTVQNSLFLLESEFPSGEAQEYMKMALAESKRISFLVEQLRETYRPAKDARAVDFNLLEVLHQVEFLLQPQFRQNHVTFEMSCEQEPIIVHGVPDQIKQVFLNICLNAVDALGEKGGQIRMDVSQPNGKKKVCIAVRDTGPGIPKEDQERIFEPFFTTKEKGTGLGLAICYEIMKDHQGKITVESEPGKGATFKVWIPVKG